MTEAMPSEPQDRPKSIPNPRMGMTKTDERDIIGALIGKYHEGLAARVTWMDRQARFFKKRFGIYPKKTFPWPNAANYHLPLIEKSIRKAKPIFLDTLSVSPVASFMSLDPQGMATEPYIDREFHWLIHQRMDSFDEFQVATDWMLGRGFSVVKVFYERRTREVTETWTPDEIPESVLSGDETVVTQWLQAVGVPMSEIEEVRPQVIQSVRELRDVTVTYTVTDYDAPRLVVKKPEDVVVAPETTKLDDAPWIVEPMLKTATELRAMVKAGYYRKDVVEAILEGARPASIQAESDVLVQEERIRQGTVDRPPEGLYRILEVYFFHDVRGNGVDERVVFVMSEDYPEEALATYRYTRKRWPYEKIFFERIGWDHTDHRGYAELLDPLQTPLKAQHDQKIDRQTISTALSFKYVPGGVHPSSIRYTPGQGIPVRSMQEFEFLTPPNTDFSFDREMMMLKAWAEETVGNPDFGLTGPLSQTGGEARTAREIGAIAQEKQQIVALDVRVFLNCWRKVFERVWEEWVDFGPREFVVRLLGEPPIAVNRTGLVVGEYSIMPTGTLWNSNPQVNRSKAMQRLQIGLGNPYINQYELWKDAFLQDDPRLVGRVLVSPQEAQAIQQQMTQQALQNKQNGKKPGGTNSEAAFQQMTANVAPQT